jgi:hypothetical protein
MEDRVGNFGSNLVDRIFVMTSVQIKEVCRRRTGAGYVMSGGKLSDFRIMSSFVDRY